MVKRQFQKRGALVILRCRSGPEGVVMVGVARCQSCEQMTASLIVRDAYDEQYVICPGCIERAITLMEEDLL